MTAPREIADRREAYEDDADNVRGDYHAAIGSLVDMAKAQAKGDRELAQLRAQVARVEATLATLDEVAYYQIGLEQMLTIQPTGRYRAAVPEHWRDEVEQRVRPFREVIRAALEGAA